MNHVNTTEQNGSALIGLVLLLVIAVLYFLPTVIAVSRKLNKPAGVIALNALLGWTVIGWIGALVMAFSMETKTDYELRTQAMMAVAKMSESNNKSL
ncbi:superinfection immunity protein [Acetobacter sp. A11-2]|uniref:superinfection immunity protein n=1 Tax=Acetobacter sp. A11-2 TaxID=3157859 RepID=UPI0032EC0408